MLLLSTNLNITSQTYVRGIPDYDYKIGTLRFMRNSKPKAKESNVDDPFEAFSGEGFSLRKTRK